MILRPYQHGGIDEVLAAFEGGCRSVCRQLPTGGGKTVEFAEVARRAAEAGTRTAILVHRDTLLMQASRKLHEAGVQHGVIAPGHRWTQDLVQVASKDALARRLERYSFGLLIPDECHHATSPSYLKIFAANPTAFILGYTATPGRLDGRGLDDVFERLVLGPTIRQMVDDGYLVEPEVYGPAVKADLAGLRTVAGDYDHRQLARVMDTDAITGDAVDHYRRLCAGRPAVAFCVSVEHAQDVAADFQAAGVRAEAVWGKQDAAQIRRAIAGLADGRVQMLASCDLVSEGMDVPALAAVLLLRPTKSTNLFLQQVGRGLRPAYAPGFPLDTMEGRLAAIAASGKPRALVLDHAGNVLRHSLPDDDREWTLEGRKRRAGGAAESAPPVRQCPKCYRCHRPAPACPECGHVYEVAARQVEERGGELERIDPAALRRARLEEERAARSYHDFKQIAHRRGHSLQWAAIRCRERGIQI